MLEKNSGVALSFPMLCVVTLPFAGNRRSTTAVQFAGECKLQ